MEQNGSSSTNPENGLNGQPALSPDEEFENKLKNLLDGKMKKTNKQKIKILEKRFPKLTKINFAKVMDLFPGDYNELKTNLLLSVASKATNMSDFQIVMDGSSNITSRRMSEEMVSAIAEMTKLEVLKVEHYFSISFSSLMELCGKLPSLKKLFFNIEAEPNFTIGDPEIFQKIFGSLNTFMFFPVSNEEGLKVDFRKSLELKCIRYLPNLSFLGDFCFVDMLPTLLDYQSLAACKQSKLKLFAIHVDKNIPENTFSKFPYVEHLQVEWDETNQPSGEYQIPGLLEFKNLKHLVMINLGTEYSLYLKQFLDVYGKRLQSLIIRFTSHPIDFNMLFNMICCSSYRNLDQLRMAKLDVQPFTVMTVKGKSVVCNLDCVAHKHFGKVSCKSLKKLDLEFAIEQSSNPTYVHLSKILSVPNLEKVKLIRVPTTLDELWETMVSVIKRKILKKVTHFQLELFNKQVTEGELISRTKCCETIENELISGKKEFVKVKQLITIVRPSVIKCLRNSQ